ncbi:hypothetical protein QJS10_CPA05g00977 [Acorus calamus]|uniref:Uncharacterized protein n=1 Tax=Acorus calamus TaxID=4465 RepID=A0AAV9ETI9_ACOCL|nr:hypothetical protein QJS10_CPA05g00977 [Acorus calamus]
MAFRCRQVLRPCSPPTLLRHLLSQTLRSKSSSTTTPHHHHDFSSPSTFIGSWTTPSDPREAERRLWELRRDYEKQVRELRREYFVEMEIQREKKRRRDEAKREAARAALEERRAAKSAGVEARAAERLALEEELRKTLMSERAKKLEYWRSKEQLREQKKNEKKDLLQRQSSMWIDENNMEKKILEALVDTISL